MIRKRQNSAFIAKPPKIPCWLWNKGATVIDRICFAEWASGCVLFSLLQFVYGGRSRWLILPVHEPEWWSLGNRETRTGHECFTARRPWLTLEPHRLWQRANRNGLIGPSSALLSRFSPSSVRYCKLHQDWLLCAYVGGFWWLIIHTQSKIKHINEWNTWRGKVAALINRRCDKGWWKEFLG